MIKNRVAGYFLRDFDHWYQIEVFRRVLYVFLVFNTLTLLPIADALWSYGGMSGTNWNYSTSTFNQLGTALSNILSHPRLAHFPNFYWVFVFGQLLFLIFGIFRIYPIISSVAIYFFTVNLNLKGGLMFTGGEVLINLMLFYLIFIQGSEKLSKRNFKIDTLDKPVFSDIQNLVNNTFYLLIVIQICLVYFFSTFYKLLDENWVSGNAIMYVSNVTDYSGKSFQFLFGDSPLLSAIATYATLLYQGFFPILIWFERIKIPFLIFGVLLHLTIAFGMGVFTFGIVMCLVYIPLLNENQIEKIKLIFSFKRKKVTP